jgi:CRP-like cAMP-binding protein/PAS domain-containing protein
VSPKPVLAARSPSDLHAEAAFKDWVRRLVKGTAELRAFEAGQIDAFMDPTTGSAILLPEAQAALQDSSRLVLSALDALPGEICVLDAAGTVVMTNKAWRTFVAARGGAGLGVREGVNFLEACRDAGARERVHAAAVATGLRQVLAGGRELFRCEYVCDSSGGNCAFTLTIAGTPGDGAVHAVVTRENVRERKRAEASRGSGRTQTSRIAAIAQAEAPNRLLAALPVKEYERLLVGFEPVKLTYGEGLYEPGEQMRHVYFPSDCVVSLLTVVEGHRALEVGLVGREGMVGSRLALGIATASVRALVQGTGTAVRIKSARFLRELHRSPALQRALLHFTDTLMSQVTQTAACNRFHLVEERLARWLLMTRERLPSSEFRLTQEFLADMLGVRRAGVTAAASALQRRKLIRYRRGNITILDQQGLEASSCSCYQRVKVEGASVESAARADRFPS